MTLGSAHIKGLLLATTGALLLTPDGLLVRLAGSNDWTLLFWRGVFIAGFILIYLLVGQKGNRPSLLPIGWKEWTSSGLGALGTIGFVLSVTHTTVANALVILSVMSLFAALFSTLFLKERIANRTWWAMGFAILGIVIVFMDDVDITGVLGNLFALGCAIATALNITLIRSDPHLNVPTCFAWGSLTVAGVGALLAPTLFVAFNAGITLGTMGLLSALAFICLGAAAKLIPAPEVTLLMLLETILGPVWVWVILNEAPSANAMVGGSIVIVTLILHSLASLRQPSKKAPV